MSSDLQQAKAEAAARRWLWARVVPCLLSALLLLFLAAPLLQLILGAVGILAEQPGLSLLRDGELFSALFLSLSCASVATLCALLLGYPLAYLLARDLMPQELLVRSLLSLPLMLPHPVAGIALLLLLAPQGLLGAFLSSQGLSFIDSAFGIILAMLFVSVPYVVRMIEASILSIDPRLELLARNLGARPMRLFAQVLWPGSRRGVLSACVLGFARALSEFGAVVVLAYFPKTAPVLIWDRFVSGGLEQVLPATLLLLLVSFLLFFLWSLAERRPRSHD